MTAPVAPVHEYYAHLRRRGVLAHLASLFDYPAKIWRHHLLVQNFFRRELLGRFRGSVLGLFWVLIQPLFLFTLYFLVFGFMFGSRLAPGVGPSPDFAIYMLSGVLVVTSFMEATSRACTVVVDNGNLVKKVAFPCELLPVHVGGVAIMVFLVGVLLLLTLGLSTGVARIGANIFLWPLVLIAHVVMALGFGLALACIHVFMRDAAYIWGMLGQALMLLSPTFYWLYGPTGDGLASRLPWAEWLTWTPLYSLVQAHRHCLGVTPEWLDGDVWSHLATTASWAIGAMVFGHALFMSRREKYADLV